MAYLLDVEGLKDCLRDYFGTAMTSGLDMAMIDLINVDEASPEELIAIAKKCKINYMKYIEHEQDEER